MKFRTISAAAATAVLLSAGAAYADHHIAAIASATSAAPAAITENATILDKAGNVLREGTNGWTCHEADAASLGAHCSEQPWEELLAAFAAAEPISVDTFSVSYMLAGEGDAPGVSNTDPFATEPTADNDWVKEGPHLMVLVPGEGAMDGVSTDPADAVYVMWKGTDYEHLMIRIAEEE